MDQKNVLMAEINPKAVTVQNLFGYTNTFTNEWIDGIVSY
jgi:hypothetical protein